MLMVETAAAQRMGQSTMASTNWKRPHWLWWLGRCSSEICQI